MRQRLFLLCFLAASLQAASLNAPAPAFHLKDFHGQPHALAQFRGKVVFINFWASWCGPCQVELPELNRLAHSYEAKKLRVVAINVDENRQDAQQLLKRLGLASSRLEILWDRRSKVVSTYNIEAMPSSFILDAHGIIRFTHVGFHKKDPAAWRQEIDSLLNR